MKNIDEKIEKYLAEKMPTDPEAKHQIDIARKTLKMKGVRALIMGKMTKGKARAILKKYGLNELFKGPIDDEEVGDLLEYKKWCESKLTKYIDGIEDELASAGSGDQLARVFGHKNIKGIIQRLRNDLEKLRRRYGVR